MKKFRGLFVISVVVAALFPGIVFVWDGVGTALGQVNDLLSGAGWNSARLDEGLIMAGHLPRSMFDATANAPPLNILWALPRALGMTAIGFFYLVVARRVLLAIADNLDVLFYAREQ